MRDAAAKEHLAEVEKLGALNDDQRDQADRIAHLAHCLPKPASEFTRDLFEAVQTNDPAQHSRFLVRWAGARAAASQTSYGEAMLAVFLDCVEYLVKTSEGMANSRLLSRTLFPHLLLCAVTDLEESRHLEGFLREALVRKGPPFNNPCALAFEEELVRGVRNWAALHPKERRRLLRLADEEPKGTWFTPKELVHRGLLLAETVARAKH